MISKELATAVLGRDVDGFYIDGVCMDDIDYIDMDDFDTNNDMPDTLKYCSNGKDYLINVYELAFKVKDWAYDKGYDIESSRYKDCQIYTMSKHEIIDEALFTTMSDKKYKECIDIIKAGEYILGLDK